MRTTTLGSVLVSLSLLGCAAQPARRLVGASPPPPKRADALRVMTLNIVHGWRRASPPRPSTRASSVDERTSMLPPWAITIALNARSFCSRARRRVP
jgi:hypothetical protein